MFDIVALEQRIKKLEASFGASLRFAKVTEVKKDGSARVELLDGSGIVTMPLRLLQPRTLNDKAQHFPEVGEHVACLFSGQGVEQGVVLGAMYSTKNASPEQDTHFAYYQFEDGTTIFYDKKEHKLSAFVEGDVEVTVKGNLNATVEGETVVEGHKDVTLRSQQVLHLEGAMGIKMRAPSISMGEWAEGGGCTARIKADVYMEGLVDQVGNRTQKGDSALVGNKNHQGDLVQQGDQQVGGDITASGTITGNPVNGCPH